jgi:6-phosphogluconate dehydrogenase
MEMQKKGQTAWNALAAAGLGVGVFIIIVAVMAQVLSQVAETQTDDSTEQNLTEAGILAMALFGDWASIIVIVAIAGIVITLLVLAFRQFS